MQGSRGNRFMNQYSQTFSHEDEEKGREGFALMKTTRGREGSIGGPIDQDRKEDRIDKGRDPVGPLMDEPKGKEHIFYKIPAKLVEGFGKI